MKFGRSSESSYPIPAAKEYEPFSFEGDEMLAASPQSPDLANPWTSEISRTPEVHAERLKVLARGMGAVAERAAVGFSGDTIGSTIDRAGRVVDIAGHIPGLGKYARIAESVVDIAGTAHGVAGQVGERGAGAVAGNYLRDVAKGAVDAVGAEFGVEVDANGQRIIRKGKLAKGVFGLMKPKKFAGTMAAAAATGARSAAMNNMPGQSPYGEAVPSYGIDSPAAEEPFNWTLPADTGESDPFGYGTVGQTTAPPHDPFSFN